MAKTLLAITDDQAFLLKTLGALCRERRMELNKRLLDVERASGVSRFSVRRFEAGKLDGRLVTQVLPICNALEVSLTDMLERAVKTTRPKTKKVKSNGNREQLPPSARSAATTPTRRGRENDGRPKPVRKSA